MKGKMISGVLAIITVLAVSIGFTNQNKPEEYIQLYHKQLESFNQRQYRLLELIRKSDLTSTEDNRKIKEELVHARNAMKGIDFWIRYMEPISYKKINGPLSVEWETEVFEKFEKPYKREGAGLTLAFLYLEEENIQRDSLLKLIEESDKALKIYKADSILNQLNQFHHFFLCNRLFLLNLASIYTTGFECPDTERVVPELNVMLKEVLMIYKYYNKAFPETALSEHYVSLYKHMIEFVDQQPLKVEDFDHFTFLREYVNPLFSLNQQFILQFKVVSKSNVDYSLNKNATSIFSKSLYHGQNSKGIFHRVKEEKILAEIDRIGKLLFYDPILSGNNLRSCASCHKPTEYFTDTMVVSSLQFNRKDRLPRNTPSLLNVEYNHLIMLDGKHISLQDQSRDVITSSKEMGSQEVEMVRKVMSCSDYSGVFKELLKYTPQEKEVTYEHIVSAITFYYSKFGKSYAPFDDAMNKKTNASPVVREGFNIFMSKAQCATCHFVPQFNGVKPPYVNSEFEVVGTPADPNFKALSKDQGRFVINEAKETKNAFRTGSLRNIQYTQPYMHNGVFKSLEEVIEFYNAGGGAGRGLEVTNQTLSTDSLHLTKREKAALIEFLSSLNEKVPFEAPPDHLPLSKNKLLNSRKVGGEY